MLSPDTVLTAIVVAAAALALGAGAWAFASYRDARDLRRKLAATTAKARSMIGARDALIAAGREAVIVWGTGLADPISFGGGAQMIEACLTGPDSMPLALALDMLAEQGVPFDTRARAKDGRIIAIRGRPAGGFAAVYLEEVSAPTTEVAPDYRALLDALPVPAWLRTRDLKLAWANRAFLAAANAPSLEAAIAENVSLDRSENELASAARADGQLVQAKRFAVIGGERRALNFTLTPIPDDGVAGAALDVTGSAEIESRLQQERDAHDETLNRLNDAIGIFGPDQRLTFYNRAYVRLWELPGEWLDKHPTAGEILDRLRELRRLPEQRDYRAWKAEHLAQFERGGSRTETPWRLSDGKMLQVSAQPHPFGGLIFLYEDVTDRLRLESQFNTASKVQKATLDTLQEGVAVFGPDGRLKLHNAAFARIWQFDAKDLAGEPHVNKMVEATTKRFGRDASWQAVVNGMASSHADRNREYQEPRADGVIISLALAPLPDGATLASFTDITDRARVETALRERAAALETANTLKTKFVERISYQFRTPLNSILGFAELLKLGTPGPLTAKQREYIDAMVTASNSLRDLINDILDLSQIEAGAMALDLEKIDLYALLSGVVERAGEGASRMGVTLKLDCQKDAGQFVADGKRLLQVLSNLLSNALQYTPSGGTVTLKGEIAEGDVRMAVADTGPGVSPDIMPTAFEQFSAKGVPGRRSGTGLGLALVNRFIELHGGWVELQSVPGEGTTVTCHIPRSVETPPHQPARAATP